MDIFETNYDINEEKLISVGFEGDYWGPPYDWKTKNVRMYERFDEFNVPGKSNTTKCVDFMYFPNDWEGTYLHKGHPCDMRGYILALVGDTEEYRMYVPSMLHIDMFVEKIKKYKKKELEEYKFDIPRFVKTD